MNVRLELLGLGLGARPRTALREQAIAGAKHACKDVKCQIRCNASLL